MQGGGSTEGNEVLVRCEDGTEKTILASGTEILGDESQVIGTVLVFQDITERKQTEKELQRLQEQLRMTNESLTSRQAQPLVQLTWVQPVAQSFVVLAAFSVALLCYGRYRALGGAWVLLISLTFLANGVVGIFYLLSWPGLAGEVGLIARLPNISGWLFFLVSLSIPSLLAAVSLRLPKRLSPTLVRIAYLVAFVTALVMGLVSVLFESRLPVFVADNVFTSRSLNVVWALVALAAMGAIVAYRRYLAESDTILVYIPLFLVLMAFEMLHLVVAGQRYNLWWYVSRVDLVAAYVVMLFGLLQEGYRLFSKERERAEERERLLRENEQLAAMAQRRASELQTTIESIADALMMVTPFGKEEGVFISVSGAPIRDGKEEIVAAVSVGRDATESKKAKAERERLLAETRQKATELHALNKELEAFSYSVSHDLRSPLRHVDSFSRILLEDYSDKPLDEQGQQYLQLLRGASQKMEALIDAMLALSRVTRVELHRQHVDLSEIAESVAADLRKEQPDRSVELSITPGMVTEGDPRLLRTVLESLFANSFKFTAKRPNAKIEFGTSNDKGSHVYFIRDNGAGFNIAYAKKLFVPFQRLHTFKYCQDCQDMR